MTNTLTKNPAALAGSFPASSFNYRRWIVPAITLAVVLLYLFWPDMAFAEDSSVDTEINKGLKYLKFFLKLFLYAVVGIAFALAGYWVLGSITDWRNNEKNGSVGNIALTVVIALMGVGIITVMVDKGLTIVDDKIKDAVGYQLEIQSPLAPPESIAASPTMMS